MSLFEAILLGLLQGLTEFLPISSSAHLRLAGPFLASGDPGAAFTAVVQIGTEAAVLLYFRKDIWRIASNWLIALKPGTNPDRASVRMGWLIIIGTIPIAVLGLLFKDAIESVLRNLYLTAAALIGFGILLGIADRYGPKKRPLDQLGWRDGLLLGFAQAMALVPGVSRSGGTITAGLALGFTREAAARYSFLLAIPAVLASGFYELIRYWGDFSADMAMPTIVATAVSFFTGYAVIVMFLRIVSSHGYMLFVLYRVLLGGGLLALLATGRIAPF
ncbi:undecaprenyl-diphosphatase [Altererythrobacter atlanticus]|uniref:Undecaprenyl-diphosphatase n=1 Tax=Croceibacterium atlanticum TaxID=1267766 RepID=A0A0F7KSI2_9SPHN|nr:undecaprenyl-diphosphate phosphatase [Croceibacterium atlanticum]AKH42096.1 Undecaprenyl-diphosphatase [Croceibacterium atlanticum]MBB5733334.1 undecaprenyl-diphosphatase [Croceibacterium atlanticum]